MESELEKKMRKVCKDSKTYEDASEKSMTTMTHIYNSNRKVLVNEYMSELKFVDYAEGLARNLTVLRKRSAKLSQQLKELSGNAQEQIEELYRTEVDIDMKLRACHGSCRSAVPFSVDHSSYQTLQTHMDQVDKTMNQRRKSAKPPVEIPHVKLQPVDIDVAPSAKYKSIPMVRKELLTQFEDIGQNHVVLENLLQEALDLSELE
ncbi:fibrinogen alpha chain [Scomber japonicus]|uniref:fibrinogen alpha chain n=1 Tax=Scomber japonicus TaxID=13676 RepID=UPI0023052EF7|nr:fibrinogen alpha chain [Scomber japonicus]